jgi:thermostable 8-oxoguanine DNA glycosylase
MMQRVCNPSVTVPDCFELPDPGDLVTDGVRWGRVDQLFTPAYWAAQAWFSRGQCDCSNYRIGATLTEEVAACLLGGHGIPAEVALAAFFRIRDLGLLRGDVPSTEELRSVLRQPLDVRGKSILYRFARQKSEYLGEFLRCATSVRTEAMTDSQLRDWLLSFRGIGLKTASWITRNWLASDSVAIIDIHIYRAGIIAGFFSPHQKVPKDYLTLEERFLGFAQALSLRASLLDAIIWQHMRAAGRMALAWAC